jgi:hypothetical protein
VTIRGSAGASSGASVGDDASGVQDLRIGTRRRAGALTSADRKDTTMLWTILLIILALWVLGLLGSIGGTAIHLLLVLAAIVLIAQLLSGRRTV